MELGDQGGGVHDGEERGSGGRGLAGEERAVGDDAVDGAADLGVAELGLGAQIFALGGGEVALGGFERGLIADGFYGVEVLLRDVVGRLRLDQRGLGGVEVAAGDGSLREELRCAR